MTFLGVVTRGWLNLAALLQQIVLINYVEHASGTLGLDLTPSTAHDVFSLDL